MYSITKECILEKKNNNIKKMNKIILEVHYPSTSRDTFLR